MRRKLRLAAPLRTPRTSPTTGKMPRRRIDRFGTLAAPLSLTILMKERQLTADDEGMSGGDPLPERSDEGDNLSKKSPRIVDSDFILAGHREVWIRHGDEMYRLRNTSTGKLYLSK